MISNSKNQLRIIDYFLLRRINDQSIIADIFLEPAQIYMYSVLKARYKDSYERHTTSYDIYFYTMGMESKEMERLERVWGRTQPKPNPIIAWYGFENILKFYFYKNVKCFMQDTDYVYHLVNIKILIQSIESLNLS